MALVHEFLFHLFSHLTLLGNGYQGECPASFSCGYLGNIRFPYTNCHDQRKHKLIQLQNKGKWFEVAVVNPLVVVVDVLLVLVFF